MSRPAQISQGTPRPFRRAFTLVETVICVVILSLAVPGVLWALSDANVQRVDPILANRARWLAQERLEDVLADRHSPARGYAYVTNANYAAENPVSGFAGFTRNVSITETGVTFGAGTGYKTVTVSVGYQDARRISRSLTLSSVVTDYAP